MSFSPSQDASPEGVVGRNSELSSLTKLPSKRWADAKLEITCCSAELPTEVLEILFRKMKRKGVVELGKEYKFCKKYGNLKAIPGDFRGIDIIDDEFIVDSDAKNKRILILSFNLELIRDFPITGPSGLAISGDKIIARTSMKVHLLSIMYFLF